MHDNTSNNRDITTCSLLLKLNQESFLRKTGPIFGSTQDKLWAKRILIQTNALGNNLNSKQKIADSKQFLSYQEISIIVLQSFFK